LHLTAAPKPLFLFVQDVVLHSKAQRAFATFLLRFVNTFCGGGMWVLYARHIGLQ
jgi:hypothetical protein